MGKRSTARRIAMQALYQAELCQLELEKALSSLDEKVLPETKNFAEELAKGAWEKRKEIDSIIQKYSKDWELDRIGKVEESILRLAIYELKYLKDAPEAVIIDEAVELAKKYSTLDAAKFINGILGAIVSQDIQPA